MVAPGGTSANAPLWAGVIALADRYAGRPLGFIITTAPKPLWPGPMERVVGGDQGAAKRAVA
jgi:hypothetical protein